MSNDLNQTNNKSNQDKNRQVANKKIREKDNKKPNTKSNRQFVNKNWKKNDNSYNGNNSSGHIIGQLKEDFELREQRLNLVYKILYVVAAIWFALFISYASEVSEFAPLYCGLLSVLTTFIINILYYIFDELRCMKMYKYVEKVKKESADNRFIETLNIFGFSLYVFVLLAVLNLFFQCIINWWSIVITLIIGLIVLSTSDCWKNAKAKMIDKDIAMLITYYAFFAVPQLLEVAVNA